MKKETKQKNKFRQVLSKMKKPLMIFSVILNILFGLALIIGLSSNNKKTQVVSATAEVDDLTNTKWEFNSTLVDIPYFEAYIDFTSNNVNWNYLYLDDDEEFIEYETIPNSSTYVIPYDNGWIYSEYKIIEITGGADVSNYTFIAWLSNNATLIEAPEVEYNFIDTISLGDNFNPVSYITQNGDYILNGFAGKHTGQSNGFLTLTGLTFVSNNMLFNTIKFAYGNINAIAPIVTQDGSTYLDLSSGYGDYLCCFGMFYQFIDENDSVQRTVQVINYRRTLIDDNGVIINAYDVRTPYIIWLNNEYRTINVISDDETIQTSSYLTINGMTTKQLLQVTSSVNTNVMGLTDVFGLLKGAFAGITGILAISILPGITLGLLLFIPLIVTIIIAVVRLIKK